MNKQCVKCQAEFEVTDGDMEFYDKVSPVFNGVKQLIPPPTHCPNCRLQRRLVHRNQIYINHRVMSNSGEMAFSVWPEDTSFDVYDNDYYYGEEFDGLQYGQKFNADTPVFRVLQTLSDTVPRPGRAILNNENSDYCNNGDDLKDCYLLFGAVDAQNCMSCELCWHVKDLLECTMTYDSELCYDCIQCSNCYGVQSSTLSQNCQDSYFLMNCRNCKNCFGCVNLRHQEYCMFNEQLTQEEYERRLAGLELSSYNQRQIIAQKCEDFFKQHPRPHTSNINTEDVSGNFIENSKSVEQSFIIRNCENVKYGYYLVEGVKDVMDFSLIGKDTELVYESIVCGINSQRLLFCVSCWEGCNNLLYCNYCFKCQDCFGCVGLSNKQYCIFNQQYTEAEYNKLVPKIIEYMQQTREWGELVPMTTAGMPYNQTLAQRFFPITKIQAEAQGLTWLERDALSVDKQTIDDYVDTYPEGADALTLRCEDTDRIFRLTNTEITHYKKFHAPLPRKTYVNRMQTRFIKVGTLTLYERTCAKTGKPITTTIPPDSGWIVWDKDVYEQEFSG